MEKPLTAGGGRDEVDAEGLASIIVDPVSHGARCEDLVERLSAALAAATAFKDAFAPHRSLGQSDDRQGTA
jgi:hypothetical protein